MKPQPVHSGTIRQADLHDPAEAARIEAFVAEHGATPFHRPAWLLAIEQGTGQRALGLVAERAGVLDGWLPLTEVRSPLFASALVSSAFGVGGGPLADNETTSLLLCRAAENVPRPWERVGRPGTGLGVVLVISFCMIVKLSLIHI